MPLDNPLYYSGDTLEIPDDIDLLEGTVFSAAGSFFASLVDTATNTDLYVDDPTPDQPNRKRLDIKSIFKTNAIGSAVAGGLSIFFDPDSGLYEVAGDVIATAALGTAIFAAIAPLIPAGASVLFIGAVGVGVATGAQVIWNSFKEIDVVEDFFASADGNLPTNLEILDANGDIAGGVLYENTIDEQEELSAIDLLINESFRATDINISVGDFIRVVDEANTDIFDETRNEYRIYDGRLVDVILEEFNDTLINLEPPANSEPIELALSNLTNLGTRNEPNRNIDIYTRNPTLTGGFVYANAENRFFVPLPVANSEEIDVKGFHPGNIYYGTDGGDDISVFENNTSFNSELETDNTLILGLEGDDFLSADVGTNFIFGGSGNDNISGIAGEDTVYFTDDFANYDYSIDDNGVVTFTHARGTQADGTDTLIDIEQAQFKDQIVSLPLDEQPDETIENNDEITLVFKTTLNPSDPKTSLINIPQDIFGEAPTLEFVFTIGSNSFNEDKQTYDLISGEVKINSIPFTPRASRSNSELLISNFYTPNFTIDGFNLGISEMRNPTLPDDPGYQLATINFSLVDNDGGTLENGRLPTDWASFASDVDEYSVGITFANEELPGTQIAVIVNKTDPAISPFELYEIEPTEEIAPDRPVEEETQDNAESEQPTDGEDSTEVVTDDNPTEQSPVVEEDTPLDEAFKPIVNDPLQTEIQLQLFAPDLESPVTEPLISTIRIPDEYTELSTLGLDTSNLAPVDVNIDIDLGAGSVPGRISFEVDENEGSGSFAPGEFNGYVFTDVFDEIPAIENVTLSETANSLGLESSDITFTENTIEVNVESLAYSPGLNALLDVEFADL